MTAKCVLPDHKRITYKNGKSECATCRYEGQKANIARKVAADPDYHHKKYEIEKSQPGYQDKMRRKFRMQKYGIDSIPDGTLCEICGNTIADAIDHNHKTDKVRGFLCRKCNLWLGIVENVDFTIKALEYLKKKNDEKLDSNIYGQTDRPVEHESG